MPRDITVTFGDGSTAVYKNAPDNITPEMATERARRDYGLDVIALDGGRPAQRGPEEGFIPALKAGFERAKGEAALTAGKVGLMSLPEAEAYQKERQAEAKSIHKPVEAGWTEDPWGKFKDLLGGSLPYMAAPIAVGVAATPLGAAAPVVGALGAGAVSLAQFTGSNLGRQLEENEKRGLQGGLEATSLPAAAAAAIPQTVLDIVSLRSMPLIRGLFKSVGTEITEAQAKEIAKQGFVKTLGDYAKTGVTTAGTGGFTEAGQAFFERLQAGLSIADPEARKEYLENFVGGVVLSGALSPVGRYVERGKEQAQAKDVLQKAADKQAPQAPEGVQGGTPPIAPTAPTPSTPPAAPTPSTPPAAPTPSTPPAAPTPPSRSAEELAAIGIDEEDIPAFLEREASQKAAADAAAAPGAQPPRSRLDDLIDEYIDAGLAPADAREMAAKKVAQEAQDDAIAEESAKGAEDVAEPVSPPSGAGVGVAGVPSAGAPAAGLADTKSVGVVPAKPDAGKPVGGEGTQPGAVDKKEEQIAAWVKKLSDAQLAAFDPSTPTVYRLATEELARRRSAEAKPAEAKPAEAKPVAPPPVETKPAEAKPAEAKPAEAPPSVAPVAATTNLRELNKLVKKLYEGGEEMSIEDIALTKRKLVADINNGLASGTPTEQIIEQAQKTARGNLTESDVAAVRSIVDSKRGVSAPTETAPKTAEEFAAAINAANIELNKAQRKYFRLRAEADKLDNELPAGDPKLIAARAKQKEADEESARAVAKSAALIKARDAALGVQTKPVTPTTTTETKPAKPRGRPKKERTAEETEAAAKLRREQAVAANTDARAVAKAEKDLLTALAPVPQGQRLQLKESEQKRSEAIRTLYALSRRNRNKPGQRAAEALKNPNIRKEELEQAKADYEATKRGGTPRMIERPTRPAPVATRMPSIKRMLTKLRKLFGDGKITETEFTTETLKAMDAAEAAKGQRRVRARARGADRVIERLLQAKRQGDIDADTANLAVWFVMQNPNVANELGISVRKAEDNEESTGGYYESARKVAVIIKGTPNPTTAAHEILHHIERMLPDAARQGILKSWVRALNQAADRAKTPAEKEFFDHLLDYHFGSENIAGAEPLYKAATAAIANGTVPYEFYQYVDPSEFWAVNASDILKGRYDVRGDTLAQLKNWVSEFIEKVKDFFGLQSDAAVIRALDAAMKTEGKFTSHSLLAQVDLPKQVTPPDTRTASQIEKEVNKALDGFDKSARATDVADKVSLLQSLRDFDKLKAYFDGLYDKLDGARISSVLFFMTNDTVAQWGSSHAPELNNTNKLLRNMRTMSRNLLAGAQDMAGEINRAVKADPTLKRKLEKVMSVATDTRIDPATDQRSKELNALYNDLGPKGKALYAKVRDYYTNLRDYYEQLLDDQIATSNMPPDARNVVMAEIRKMYETDKKINPYFPFVRNRGEFWLQVGKGEGRQFYTFSNEMERSTIMQYLAKEKGESVDQMLKDGVFKKGDTLESFRKATSDMTDSLKAIFQKIDSSVDPKELSARVAIIRNSIKKDSPRLSDADVSAEAYEQAKDEATRDVKDAIYELYLMTLPDQSFRRSFIARKDIPGYNVDLMRNFSTYAVKTSSQLPRIKYGPKLRNSLRAAEKSLEGNPDASKIMRFVNEMERRVDLELNPYPTPAPGTSPKFSRAVNRAVDLATRMSFVHYLSAAASALVQSTGMLYGASTLGARHGYSRTAVELGKLSKVWNEFGVQKENADGSVTWHAPSIVHSKSVATSADEKRAVRQMMGAGIGEYTLTSEMLNRGRVSTAEFEGRGSKLGRGVMMVLGGPFQTIERLVQESLFIASYRLSREDGAKKGLSGEALHQYAVDQAIADVHDSVGNMAETNRPPILRNALGRLLMQFMLYPLFITTRWMREAYRVVAATEGEAKYQAFKELAGVMGVTWMLAGLAGVPLFSTVLGYLGAWLEDEDEKMGRKTLKDLDYWTWWRTVWLPEQMGNVGLFGRPLTEVVGMSKEKLAALIERGPANLLTGADISSRTSINPVDMFSGQNKEVRTTKEGALQFAEDRAGPFLGMILSYMDAYNAFADGDMQRGMEKMLPAILKNPAVAWKYANEGIKDYRGATILSKDSMTTGRLMYQAIGLRLDEVANQQKFLFALAKEENKIRFEREDILKNLRDSRIIKKDIPRFNDWLNKREVFNRKFPSFAIEDADIVRSIEGAATRASSAVRGFTPTEQNLPIFQESVLNRARVLRTFEEETSK